LPLYLYHGFPTIPEGVDPEERGDKNSLNPLEILAVIPDAKEPDK
jgi:hypothetical protein